MLDDSVVEGLGLAGKTLFAFVSIVNAGARPLSWGVRRWRDPGLHEPSNCDCAPTHSQKPANEWGTRIGFRNEHSFSGTRPLDST